jgi:hypothetical protein
MTPSSEAAALARLVLALREFRRDIVLVGGWAHRLSRLHPLSNTAVTFEPLFSEDADMVLPANVISEGEDLGESLRKAGFKGHFLGENRPPVTHYRLEEGGGFYAEFLTPLIGRPRTGTRTIAGVNVQELRFLDVLMIAPWSVSLREPDYPVGRKPVEIRISNATSYLAQKLLVLDRRDANDRGKDVLYIHDTVITFGTSLDALQEIWNESVVPAVHERLPGRLRSVISNQFSEVSESAKRAGQISKEIGRPVDPEEIAGVCRAGLGRIFGVAGK